MVTGDLTCKCLGLNQEFSALMQWMRGGTDGKYEVNVLLSQKNWALGWS